jgi:hypothetical protein
MAADLVLIELPGGPFRLTITDVDGERWFTAAEACPCTAGGHWHDVADAPTWHGLLHDLLTRFLTSTEVPT